MLYISFHYRYKKQIIIISIILILLSISGYFIYINIPKKEEIKISKEEPIKNTKPEKVEEKKYKVDIKGQTFQLKFIIKTKKDKIIFL